MKITGEHVQALLDSGLPQPTMVLQEGEVRLLGEQDLRSQRYAGALIVASRDALRAQLGHRELSRRDLEELAAGLEAAVSNLGG
ncbi:hypothetical protein [Prauserella muralis]|uniref:Uncharacterized protein n=1 Tax=Prauserella muralis TaxID=588067 RepID=A0A2V4AKD2_9PSEU|nr:hypothetical protein [Prauserella muralis]PXY20672.1 hypothetical protein BAY60_24345 [Prauserella muralis]TWE29666.1 hypothetical protein FHX69_2353 [Prauserella muralis]